ncbi:lipopolysaccharide biosynthesis protein [Botryobacter ruber]|uniref:lipopolysaccharide biosynthesis protein n=1 Tax=Botryobacter ruber TaxID=2171629 RepID=UPI000E09EB55|nr:oligosaccharide flippase family protein [Botryobacter ruber]
MIYALSTKISALLKSDNQRSEKIIKNIIFSFGVKGGTILIGLLLVPMTINYISPLQYGVWLTISSIINWMSFFDVGMGNGLRNKLTESLALHEYEEARKYVSTTYAILLILSALLFILFWLIIPFVNWYELLNLDPAVSKNIQLIILIMLGSFCIKFVVQTVNIVLSACQEPAKASVISFFGQLGLLITVFILKDNLPGSLLNLALALSIVPILVMIVASLLYYKTEFKHVAPSINMVDFKYAGSIFNTGVAFFIVQIGAMILFQTDNIIITQVLGPEAVTEFNIVHKLFSIIIMVFTIIVTPYWSAYTDAYVKKDFNWIKKNILLMRKFWFLFSIFAILICFFAQPIYKLWIGTSITINNSLSLATMVYVIVYIWQTLHVFLLNGLNKIRLQLILVVFSAIVNIPLAIYLAKIYGLAGIISANTIVFVVMGAVFYIQANKIINQKAAGIWNK